MSLASLVNNRPPVPALTIFLPLLAAAVLTASAWVAGRLVTRRLIPEVAPERVPLSLALGFAVLAQVALLLGLVGALRPGAWIATLVAVHILGIGGWRELGSGASRPVRRIFLLLLGVLPLVILAFYPPTAFDATMYHLPYARAFVETGGVPFLPDLRYPVFPQLDELLLAGTFLLRGGDSGGNLVHLVLTIATAALVGVWGRQAFSPAAGWLGAATFLGSPLIVGLAVTGYVEATLALFTTAALYAVWRWRASARIGWLVLAGAFAASAGGVKYLGIFFVIFLLVEAALASWRDRALRPLLLTGLVMAAILAPTYGRILFYTGNPVFPFFSGVFGASPWEGGRMLGGETLPGKLVGLLTLPWDAIFDRETTGSAPPLSPAFLLGIPFLLWGALRDERVRSPVLIAAMYSLVYLVLARDVRYLAAVLPILSMALGGVLSELVEEAPRIRRRGVVTAVLALGLFLPGWLYAGYRIVREGPVPLTREARDRYLADRLPVYPALAWLNRTRGSGYTVYALHVENMAYFAEGRFLGDAIGPANFYRVVPLLGHPRELDRELERLGADHLLIPLGKGSGLPDTPEARRLFQPVYEDDHAVIYQRVTAG